MQVLLTRHLRCPRVLLFLPAVCFVYFEITEVLGTETADLRPAGCSIWGLGLDAGTVGGLVLEHRVVSTS